MAWTDFSRKHYAFVCALGLTATGCTRADEDCDPANPDRSPRFEEVDGDGVDQDCDGSDRPTVSIREAASGRYHSDLVGAKLGWHVTCGPDRGGDGEGDIAAIASEFGVGGNRSMFAAALPAPVEGEHLIEDVLDLRVRPSPRAAFATLAALVSHDVGGGLLLGNGDNAIHAPYLTEVVWVTSSGTIGPGHPAIGSADGDVIPDYGIASTYAGPADFTGDPSPDYALGAMIFEELPDGFVVRDEVQLLAVEHEDKPTPTNYEVGSAAGDLNGDGRDDLVLAYVRDPLAVVAYGPMSSEGPHTPLGPSVGRFGATSRDDSQHRVHSVSVGDLNGDGLDDLVIGDKWFDERRGGVFVWFGPLGSGDHDLTSADVQFVGELPGSNAGEGLAVADLDADGASELIVGASDFRRVLPGLVYIFDGPLRVGTLTAMDAITVLRGEEPGSLTGFSIAGCDLDRDGRDELVVGAPELDLSEDVADGGALYWLDGAL